LVAETTITRRPNNLASNEYAPGPSNARATAFKVDSKIKSESLSVENAAALASKQAASMDSTGVNMPRHNKMAPIKMQANIHRSAKIPRVDDLEKMIVAATDTRKSSSATPGRLSGNMAKSRCTAADYGSENVARHTKEGYPPVTPLRGSA
jgi:hypothetical protein